MFLNMENHNWISNENFKLILIFFLRLFCLWTHKLRN